MVPVENIYVQGCDATPAVNETVVPCKKTSGLFTLVNIKESRGEGRGDKDCPLAEMA